MSLFILNLILKLMKKKYISRLTEAEKKIIVDKGTEPPFSGRYDNFFEKGFFACRACSSLLYNSVSKFNSGCGWPSFDDEIAGAIKRIPDYSSGKSRTEILCAKCNGHLGHVFLGENMTEKNTRHCVNSLSIRFIPINKEEK